MYKNQPIGNFESSEVLKYPYTHPRHEVFYGCCTFDFLMAFMMFSPINT